MGLGDCYCCCCCCCCCVLLLLWVFLLVVVGATLIHSNCHNCNCPLSSLSHHIQVTEIIGWDATKALDSLPVDLKVIAQGALSLLWPMQYLDLNKAYMHEPRAGQLSWYSVDQIHRAPAHKGMCVKIFGMCVPETASEGETLDGEEEPDWMAGATVIPSLVITVTTVTFTDTSPCHAHRGPVASVSHPPVVAVRWNL